jgi:hypothetical protein
MKALLLFALLGIASVSARAEAVVGQPAPAFTAHDLDGKSVSLSDYAGKIVVLEWTNVDCPFVKKHYESGNIPKLQQAYTAKGVVWLSINSSAPGKEGNYPAATIQTRRAAVKAASTDYLTDADGTVGRLYGAKTTPHFFIVDARGVLRYAGAIDSIPSPDPADIAKAENYVSEALDALLAGQPVKTASTRSYGCSVKY